MERVEKIDDRRHTPRAGYREDINRLPGVDDDGGMGGRGYLSNQKGRLDLGQAGAAIGWD